VLLLKVGEVSHRVHLQAAVGRQTCGSQAVHERQMLWSPHEARIGAICVAGAERTGVFWLRIDVQAVHDMRRQTPQRADLFCLKYCHLECGFARSFDSARRLAAHVHGVITACKHYEIIWRHRSSHMMVTSTGRQRIDLIDDMIEPNPTADWMPFADVLYLSLKLGHGMMPTQWDTT